MKIKGKINTRELLKPTMNSRGEVNIPKIIRITPEVEAGMNKEFEQSNTYEKLKQDKLHKEYHKIPITRLREVADYLWKNIYNKVEVDKKEVCKDLKMKMDALNREISNLNFYDGFPLTIIPVRRKKDFIRAISSDRGDYILWKKKKFRTMTSMGVIYDKGVMQGERKFENNEIREKQIITVKH